MSSSEQLADSPLAAPEPAAQEIAVARQRLAELDNSVFAGLVPLSPNEQNDLIRRAVRKLFGHGL